MPWYTRKEKTAQPPERVTGRFITIPQLIGSILLLIFLVVVPLMLTRHCPAAEANVDLEHVETTSMTRVRCSVAFKTYMNYCSSCHELGFARYARTAEDLEIPEQWL